MRLFDKEFSTPTHEAICHIGKIAAQGSQPVSQEILFQGSNTASSRRKVKRGRNDAGTRASTGETSTMT
jgi:hypothetical protein